MSLSKPPIVKLRKSRLNGADFSSNFQKNSSNNFFQQAESSFTNDAEEKDLFNNFLSSNERGSTSDLRNSSHYNNSEFLGNNSNNRYSESSNFDFNIIKRHRKKTTTKTITNDEISDHTNKRPPITPRKSLHIEEPQARPNGDETSNFNHFHSESNRSNPFIVKHGKAKDQTNGKKQIDDVDLNKSFIDHDAYKVLRSIFNYENRSVDLELDQNIIKMKPINGKL